MCGLHWHIMSKQDYERTVRKRVGRPGRRMRSVCPVLRVHRYTMSQQSGDEWAGWGGGCGECVWVHYDQTVRHGMARPYRP